MSTFQQFFPGNSGNIGSSEPINVKPVEFLLVGGGGGAGGNGYISAYVGGGGGAGEMIEAKNFMVTNGQTFTITIGAGGIGGTAGFQNPNASIVPGTPGTNGNESLFGNISAGGGGGGGGGGPATTDGLPTIGGSGGGRGTSDVVGINGESRSKYNIVTNVFNKINTIISYTSNSAGITTSLGNPGGGAGGNRGQGRSNDINGSSVTYATGGVFPASGNGNTNTGSGGNSSFPSASGGSGGSGIFIIRWPTAYPDAASVTGNTPTPLQPGFYTYRWNGSGSITF